MVELEGETDPLQIAMKELKARKIPIIIRRYLPDNSYEDWGIDELKIIDRWINKLLFVSSFYTLLITSMNLVNLVWTELDMCTYILLIAIFFQGDYYFYRKPASR